MNILAKTIADTFSQKNRAQHAIYILLAHSQNGDDILKTDYGLEWFTIFYWALFLYRMSSLSTTVKFECCIASACDLLIDTTVSIIYSHSDRQGWSNSIFSKRDKRYIRSKWDFEGLCIPVSILVQRTFSDSNKN